MFRIVLQTFGDRATVLGRCEERVLHFMGCEVQEGDAKSEGKLSNGRSRSYKETKLLLFAGNERSQSWQGDKSQHPNLPWNFMTHGFLDPSAFPELVLLSYGGSLEIFGCKTLLIL